MIEFISGYVCGALSVSFIVGLSIFIYDNAYKQGKRDYNSEVLGVKGVTLSVNPKIDSSEDGTFKILAPTQANLGLK
jgi:hypothetical protein